MAYCLDHSEGTDQCAQSGAFSCVLAVPKALHSDLGCAENTQHACTSWRRLYSVKHVPKAA